MKKNIALLVCAICVWGNMVTSNQMTADSIQMSASGSAQVGNLHAHTTESVTTQQTIMSDATSFLAEHKHEVALLAVAITLGLSLKYCSWVQGLVGIDTEAEIDDWRVFIQK